MRGCGVSWVAKPEESDNNGGDPSMKKLIALAVAGAAAAPVYAQSNVQLYGVLDANY